MKFFSDFKFDKRFFIFLLSYCYIAICIFIVSFLGIKFNDLVHIVDVDFIAQQLTNGISSSNFIIAVFAIDLVSMFLFSIFHYFLCYLKDKFSSKSK